MDTKKVTRNAEFWADKIVFYCLKHKMTYHEFHLKCGISQTAFYEILTGETKNISPKTLGKLLSVLDTEEPPCYN